MAMTDYPTAADFLEPMPANPVDYGCNLIKDVVLPTQEELESVVGTVMTDEQKTVIGALATVSEVYFNYNKVSTYCADWAQTDATGNLGDGQGWNALACNQVVLPMGSDGTGMFIA